MTIVTKSPVFFDELVDPIATKLSVRFAWIIFVNLFYYSAHFLLLFISPADKDKKWVINNKETECNVPSVIVPNG